MKNLALGFAVLLGFCGVAHAQSTPPLATVVTACGTPPSTYNAGTNRPILQDVNGVQCGGGGASGGTVTANQGTAGSQPWPVKIDQTTPGTTNGVVVNSGSLTVVQPTGTNLHAVIDSGAITTVSTVTNPVGVKGADGSAISSATNPLPTTPYDSTGAQANFSSTVPVQASSQYPTSSTAITGNGTGTTGAVVGTLSGTSGKTTYICGFNVSATGGVATLGPITIAGLVGSSMVFQLFSTATGANLTWNFSTCIPASAQNTAITTTTTADATASAVDVNSFGYQQ